MNRNFKKMTKINVEIYNIYTAKVREFINNDVGYSMIYNIENQSKQKFKSLLDACLEKHKNSFIEYQSVEKWIKFRYNNIDYDYMLSVCNENTD